MMIDTVAVRTILLWRSNHVSSTVCDLDFFLSLILFFRKNLVQKIFLATPIKSTKNVDKIKWMFLFFYHLSTIWIPRMCDHNKTFKTISIWRRKKNRTKSSDTISISVACLVQTGTTSHITKNVVVIDKFKSIKLSI